MDQSNRITYSVVEAAEVPGVSKPTMLKLVRQEHFPSFHVGRRILIPRQGLLCWAERMGVEKGSLQ